MDKDDFKKLGLKNTLPRRKIFAILEQNSERHLSAEDIYKILLEEGEEIGLATVYRVLTQFQEAGLIVRHHFESGQSVYEIDNGEHHDHIVCLKCNYVYEFVDSYIEKRQEEIAQSAGFSITDHSLTIYGVCANCQSV